MANLKYKNGQQEWISLSAIRGPKGDNAEITLNGQLTEQASFYAPIVNGTSGQFLQSNGPEQAPTWVNQPIIPTVNNGILTIQKNGSDIATFSANSNSNVTANISVPILSDIVDLIYPIGSIYMSVNGTNPGTFLGGTWTSWGNGRVPVGVDTTNTNFNTVEKVGGSVSLQAHTHSINITSGDNSVGHTHAIRLTTGNQSAGHTHKYSGTTGGQSANHTHSFTTDSGGAHNHTTQGRANSGSTTPAIFESFAGAGSTRNVTVPRSGTNGAHTHSGTTGNQSADHTHSYSGTTEGISANHTHSWSGNSEGVSANHTHSVSGDTGSTGGGNAENLQPYITCYMWKRTA